VRGSGVIVRRSENVKSVVGETQYGRQPHHGAAGPSVRPAPPPRSSWHTDECRGFTCISAPKSQDGRPKGKGIGDGNSGALDHSRWCCSMPQHGLEPGARRLDALERPGAAKHAKPGRRFAGTRHRASTRQEDRVRDMGRYSGPYHFATMPGFGREMRSPDWLPNNRDQRRAHEATVERVAMMKTDKAAGVRSYEHVVRHYRPAKQSGL